MNEAMARRIVHARSGGRCELCRAPATDWAHRRSRAQGGPWTPANGLHLCRPCHAWTEHNPAAAQAGGWRLVHDHTDPTIAAVWLQPALVWPGWWCLVNDGMYVPAPETGACPDQLPPWIVRAA